MSPSQDSATLFVCGTVVSVLGVQDHRSRKLRVSILAQPEKYALHANGLWGWHWFVSDQLFACLVRK